jgi:hypothetical protein
MFYRLKRWASFVASEAVQVLICMLMVAMVLYTLVLVTQAVRIHMGLPGAG